jgi:hypothetical protein
LPGVHRRWRQALPALESRLAVFPCPLAKLPGHGRMVFSSLIKNEIVGKSGVNTKIRVKVKAKLKFPGWLMRQYHDFRGGVVVNCAFVILFESGFQTCWFFFGEQLLVRWICFFG